MNKLSSTTLIASLLFLGTACNKGDEFFEKEKAAIESGGVGEVIVIPPEVLPPEELPNKEADAPVELCKDPSNSDLICNPLGGGVDKSGDVAAKPKSVLGLIASIYEGQPNFNHMDRYLSEGFKHPEMLYFSNFDVPTRSFDSGFGVGQNFLQSVTGEKLIEWFAIVASGHILLPLNEEPGLYHIVTLSDDGVRVKVGDTALISNPGVHAPTLDCSASLFELKRDEEKKFELQYFQGPRYHIALMTFIKKVEDPQSFNLREACSAGNSFDPLSIGYKVISPAWFTLPLEHRK